MHGRHLAALAAALLGLTLAACSGGGGGSPTASMPQTPAPAPQTPTDPTPAPMPPRTAAPTPQSVAGADPERTVRAARAATRNLPRFGSVTQSTNAVNGITTDRARVNLDPAAERLRVTVERQGQDPLILDSNDALGEPRRPDSDSAEFTARAWVNARITDSGVTISDTRASWSPDTSDDYWSAAGYWVHIAGENLISSAPTIADVEMGAFYDGSSFRTPPERLPTGITARYDGSVEGAVVLQYGTSAGAALERPEGTLMIADWFGPARLTANFDGVSNSISGCIGCTGSIMLDEWLVSNDGDLRGRTPVSTRIHLGSTGINRDGTFRGSTVTLSEPDAVGGSNPVTSSGGSWGGKFSDLLGSRVPAPYATAGTVGGAAGWRDGTAAAYIGNFFATLDE